MEHAAANASTNIETKPRPASRTAATTPIKVEAKSNPFANAAASFSTRFEAKPRGFAKPYPPFVEGYESGDEIVTVKPPLSIKVPTSRQPTGRFQAAQSPKSAGSLFVSPGVPTAPFLGPSILDKQPTTIPEEVEDDQRSLFGSPIEESHPLPSPTVADQEATKPPHTVRRNDESLFVSDVESPPPSPGSIVLDEKTTTVLDTPERKKQSLTTPQPANPKAVAETPTSVPNSLRRAKPTVSEESRIQHATAGATRQTTVEVLPTGFKFHPVETKQQEETTRKSSTIQSVARDTDDPIKGPISLHKLAAGQKGPKETAPPPATGHADQGNEWDNIIMVHGRESTVGQYVIRSAAHGRNARAIANSLQKLLKKADLEPIFSDKVKDYVQQTVDVDIPLGTKKQTSPKTPKVLDQSTASPVDLSTPRDTSDLSPAKSLASPPQTRPTQGGKTVAPGWLARTLCCDAAAEDTTQDDSSDSDGDDSQPRPVFMYTVYRQVHTLADGNDDDYAEPPPEEMRGRFTSLAQANAAAMEAAQAYTSLKGVLQWEYDDDNAAQYTLTSPLHRVKAWVKRTIEVQEPDTPHLPNARMWDILVDDTPQDKLYSSVDQANTVAAQLALDRHLKALPRSKNLDEMDLMKAEATRLVREIRLTCDRLHAPFSESGAVKAGGDDIWRISVRARRVHGPVN